MDAAEPVRNACFIRSTVLSVDNFELYMPVESCCTLGRFPDCELILSPPFVGQCSTCPLAPCLWDLYPMTGGRHAIISTYISFDKTRYIVELAGHDLSNEMTVSNVGFYNFGF